MSEIIKLRQRLKNVNKGTVEYRMTVVEAKALLAEVDAMSTPDVVEPAKVVEPATVIRVMDGGTF